MAVLLFIVIDFRSTMAVLPQHTPAINADGLTRDEIIKEYFNVPGNELRRNIKFPGKRSWNSYWIEANQKDSELGCEVKEVISTI